MKKRRLTKIPAKVLVLGLFIAGLILVGSTRTVSVDAKTCYKAWLDFYTADNAYDTARISLFYGSPTTCAADCASGGFTGAAYTQCVADCQTTRQTSLAAADTNLLAAALGTCTPLTVDECAQARAMADACIVQYPYPDYSDLDERLAVYEQYSACRLASKVDSCQ